MKELKIKYVDSKRNDGIYEVSEEMTNLFSNWYNNTNEDKFLWKTTEQEIMVNRIGILSYEIKSVVDMVDTFAEGFAEGLNTGW